MTSITKERSAVTRREMIKGSVALAALALTEFPLRSFGFNDPEEGERLIPFLDQQPPGKMLRWEQLKSWITPNNDVYHVQHYGVPKFDAANWRLEISGKKAAYAFYGELASARPDHAEQRKSVHDATVKG